MPMTLAELAQRIGAQVRGEGSRIVEGCASIDDANEREVTFVANIKYVKSLASTKAAAAIVSARDAAEAPESLTLLIAKDAYVAFREAMVALHGFRAQPSPGIDARAVIDPAAKLGRDCSVNAFVVIEAGAVIGERCVFYPHCYVGRDAVLGDDCVLYPNVTVYDRCVLGNRVILHAGCVIGQDGFGYATHARPGEAVAHHKIPQAGNAVIEDDVEMGACCAVDRATVGSTRVGRGTKFSDLVAIGHGAQVGKHNLLVAQVGIAGSTQTGDYVVMGGQAGIAGHLTIGAGAQIAAKAGVMDDVPAGEKWGSTPAMPLTAAKRGWIAIRRMDEMQREVRRLTQRLEELEALARKEQK